MRDKMIYTVPI